ncbi:MAG: hypothetical protein A2172_02790 [Candidatus Woykebacteria bacterium RBG_13_40_15]|uniref:Uncharacterized protein n=1 Tax=Candidatus Woykebacteria bacterium RBG_13_40_15 TaxID=1802593 RepID=A0A1G1W8R1_9BACT|nr:MAG: hypothetical protein A2172_02790 [Candidatus Woykebacteria bacterium RBG_13_40_15]
MADLRKQFSKIYDQYINKIYRFVFIKVNSRELAEDLTAEVFTRCWEKFKRVGSEGIENIQAFLFQAARNLVIDYYRQKGRVRLISTQDIWVPDPRVDLEKEAGLGSEVSQIRFALNKIPENYAEIVVWHYLDQLSVSEIAKLLNKSEGAVRVTLHRALKELRENIEGV